MLIHFIHDFSARVNQTTCGLINLIYEFYGIWSNVSYSKHPITNPVEVDLCVGVVQQFTHPLVKPTNRWPEVTSTFVEKARALAGELGPIWHENPWNPKLFRVKTWVILLQTIVAVLWKLWDAKGTYKSSWHGMFLRFWFFWVRLREFEMSLLEEVWTLFFSFSLSLSLPPSSLLNKPQLCWKLKRIIPTRCSSDEKTLAFTKSFSPFYKRCKKSSNRGHEIGSTRFGVHDSWKVPRSQGIDQLLGQFILPPEETPRNIKDAKDAGDLSRLFLPFTSRNVSWQQEVSSFQLLHPKGNTSTSIDWARSCHLSIYCHSCHLYVGFDTFFFFFFFFPGWRRRYDLLWADPCSRRTTQAQGRFSRRIWTLKPPGSAKIWLSVVLTSRTPLGVKCLEF